MAHRLVAGLLAAAALAGTGARPAPVTPVCRSVTRRGAVRLRLRFHLRKARVIVRELVEVRPGDLPRNGDIVIGRIRLPITSAVLELDVHPLWNCSRSNDATSQSMPIRSPAARASLRVKGG